MKAKYITILLLFVSILTYSQKESTQIILEDKDGNSSIYLPKGGYFRLNTSDASLKLSYIFSNSKNHIYGGFDISGNTQNGILPLLSKGQIVPGINFNVLFGYKELEVLNNVVWIGLKFGYEGASFDIFNPKNDFNNQIKNVSFNNFSTSLYANTQIFESGRCFLGFSVGLKRSNNYKDLDDLELTDETVFFDTLNHITRSYKIIRTVKVGDYKTYNVVPINIDLFWYPTNQFGLYHFWRSKLIDNNITNSFGTGFYLLKNGSPFSSIGGILFQINDISKIDAGFSKNITISFIIGYKFSFQK